MYPAYAKWVQSHRDLPIKLNQWCNVVVSFSHELSLTASSSMILDGKKNCFLTVFYLFLSAMGVQASPALPEDKRVPVAGGTYGLCHQRGGS